MTKSKSTKRALLLSVLSLIMCFAMLLGTTYAWFTDTVSSAGNVIRSGILDVDLVDAEGNSLEGKVLSFKKADAAPADEEVLWEPGCTYNLQDVYVVNKGNLALKYKLIINGIDGDAKLLEAIEWTVFNPDTNQAYNLDQWYSLLPGQGNDLPIRLQGHMREDAGNEYQDLVAEGISIMVYAIQDTVEFDSFDNQYDKLAQEPVGTVTFRDPAIATPMFSAADRAGIMAWLNDNTKVDTAINVPLDAVYQFSATETESNYADWHADFVIYADKDVPADSILIAGQYDSTPLAWGVGKFPWIALTNEGLDIAAGDKIRLLEAADISFNYNEVMKMKDFFCGLADISAGKVLSGTTITVELHLYEATGAGIDSETGKDILVSTTTYTFGETAVVNDAQGLKDAFAAGQDIVLTDDVVLSSKLEVPAGKDINLNLNGKTLSGAFDNNGGSALIENKGALTVTNGTIVSLAEYPDVDWGTEGFPTYATNTISNRGTLVIGEGAYIENKTNVGGASYAIDNYAGADVTINGGIIRAKDVAIRMFAGNGCTKNDVTINGGLILGKRAVWVQLASNDSTKAPVVNLTVNGGTLASNVVGGTGNVIYSYSYGNSFANTNITITGGEFIDGSVVFGGGYKGDTENVTITGGTFEQDVVRWISNTETSVVFAKNN